MEKVKIELNEKIKQYDEHVYQALGMLYDAFGAAGHELYLVGGCVRDLLLGREPKDYDLCTDALAEDVGKILGPHWLIIETGIKHGTVTALLNFWGPKSVSFEITTYRIDGAYTDSRHPDTVTFVTSLEEDLKRRDFTINSFAYDFNREEINMLDKSFLNDLKLGIIKTVGEPTQRFKEDALRMLRAVRFSAQLNFSINKETYEAIKLNCDWMLYVSRERVRDELTKILLSDNPQRLELFAITGLEKHSFDGYHRPILDMLTCEHENPWHYTDVFHHTMDVVKNLPKVFELRWAGLLHDVGKPKVKKPRPQGPEGHYVYYGHPDVSAEIALQIMDILKFSNDQKNIIYTYVKYHDAELAACKKATFKKIVAEIGIDHFADFIKLRFADASAHRLIKDTKYAVDAIDIIKQRFGEILEKHEAITLKDLQINGYDLMDIGYAGKEIGIELNNLLEYIMEYPDRNKKDYLMRKARKDKHE